MPRSIAIGPASVSRIFFKCLSYNINICKKERAQRNSNTVPFFFQNSYSDSEDNNAMNYVTVEGIDIKNEDFDCVDNSIYEEEISADTLDSKPLLKDQDEFENSENKPLKIQERKPKPHSCSQCGERFRKKSNLLRHVQRVHEGKEKKEIDFQKIYKCSICSSSFTRNIILTDHMTTVHNIEYHKCSKCDKRFRKKANLLGHVGRVHEGKMKKKIYKCPICSSTFTRNMSLTKHMTTIHNIDYECTVCNVTFKTNPKLKRHLKIEHNIRKSYECSTCNATFSVSNSLKKHIETVHEKKKPYLCPECGKSFSGTNNLKIHVEAIHEKKEYECTKCDEVFKTLYLYKAHMAYKHEGQQMHKCPMCDAELKSKQTLRTHIAFVHEGKACERMRWDQF